MRFSTRGAGMPARRTVGTLAMILGVLFILKTMPAWAWLVLLGAGLIVVGWFIVR